MKDNSQNYVYPLSAVSLDDVPFHSAVQGIDRLTAKTFPLHLAVHQVVCDQEAAHYVQPHQHEAVEVNLILSDSDEGLVYDYKIGDQEFEVRSPAAVWIPGGMQHTALAKSGKGTYVCMILASYDEAFDIESANSSDSPRVENKIEDGNESS